MRLARRNVATVGLSLAIASCAPAAPPAHETRSAKATSTRAATVRCSSGALETLVPFYEGLRLAPTAAALRGSGMKNVTLAYPGPLSMPFVAWRCGDDPWTAVFADEPTVATASLDLRARGDDIAIQLECLGGCALDEVHVRGSWRDMAEAVARRWALVPSHPPLAARYDRFHYFVRQWVSRDDPPAREDWTAEHARERMRTEPPRTLAFVFGMDPNEVDLEGRYFWSDGALAEARSLAPASPAVAQLHWLNLRSFKYAIPRLAMNRPPSAEVRAAAKLYANGANDFEQYVFRAIEMCLGAETWQASRFEELRKLVELGFRVIALDEFPTSPRWGAEGCRATNHLHRPNDYVDEQRVVRDFVRRLAAYADAHGVLLTSEEPSLMLLPYTSGYMDGTLDDPPDMYEVWKTADRIPLFSAMFGDRLTPYTRSGGRTGAPRPWLVQEKIPYMP